MILNLWGNVLQSFVIYGRHGMYFSLPLQSHSQLLDSIIFTYCMQFRIGTNIYIVLNIALTHLVRVLHRYRWTIYKYWSDLYYTVNITMHIPYFGFRCCIDLCPSRDIGNPHAYIPVTYIAESSSHTIPACHLASVIDSDVQNGCVYLRVYTYMSQGLG